jgi:non-ribosomal peptide synthetase component F
VNLLPVRSVLSIDEPFMEYLRRLRDDVLEAQQHGAYPFEALVEDLHAANDKSRTPIFDILMQLQDRIPERGDGDHRGIEITPLNVENPMSKFDITFNFTERKSTIAAAIEYNVLLYKKDTIENYAQKLSNIIARAAAEKFLLIKDIIRENDSNNNSSLSSAQFIDADISERFDL